MKENNNNKDNVLSNVTWSHRVLVKPLPTSMHGHGKIKMGKKLKSEKFSNWLHAYSIVKSKV